MATNATLIQELKNAGILHTSSVIGAFRSVDRKDFVLPEYAEEAYVNEPLPIGYGQTISQPYTVAFMLELLDVKKGMKVLDVGSGSGYTTALIAHIVGPTGVVCGVELIPELVALGSENLARYDFPNATISEAGTALGLPDRAPFDRILVSASATELPHTLVRQLRDGGRIVVPVGNEIWEVEKRTIDDVSIEKHPGFVFVPLIGREG